MQFERYAVEGSHLAEALDQCVHTQGWRRLADGNGWGRQRSDSLARRWRLSSVYPMRRFMGPML
jgi:hypothetical protein